MSHVEDGRLHEYLDGQLSAIEAVHLERHLADCPACRVRLDEERALTKRAGRQPAHAAPLGRGTAAWPEPATPPLTWRLRVPLAWAATALVALVVVWSARGLWTHRAGQAQAGRTAPRPVAVVPPGGPAASQPVVAAPILAAAPRVAPESAGLAAAHERAASASAPAPTPPEPSPAPGAPAVRVSPRDELDAWQEIGFDDAGRLLGQPPVAIPGLPIRRLARSRTGEPVVALEQLVDSGTVVRLYESRGAGGTDSLALRARDSAAGKPPGQPAPLRVGRDLGPLRVEIEGPLAADSLSRLLALVR